MQGTYCESIIKLHSETENIIPGEIIPINVDDVFMQDSTFLALRQFFVESLNQLANIKFYISQTSAVKKIDGYTSLEKYIESLPVKLKVKLFENCKGNWNFQLFKKKLIKPHSIFIGRGSTLNFFSPLGNLNICAGKTDIIKLLKTQTYDFFVPKIVQVDLNGDLPPLISGKDIALFLQKQLSPELESGNYILEFSGSIINSLKKNELATIALHNLKLNVMAFTFPPSKWDVENAKYHKRFKFDLSKMPSFIEYNNEIIDLRDLKYTRIDKVYIGNSYGGSIKDFEYIAGALRNKKIKIPCFITPETLKEFILAAEQGYINEILKSGCTILHPPEDNLYISNKMNPFEGENIFVTAIDNHTINSCNIFNYYSGSLSIAINVALTGGLGVKV